MLALVSGQTRAWWCRTTGPSSSPTTTTTTSSSSSSFFSSSSASSPARATQTQSPMRDPVLAKSSRSSKTTERQSISLTKNSMDADAAENPWASSATTAASPNTVASEVRAAQEASTVLSCARLATDDGDDDENAEDAERMPLLAHPDSRSNVDPHSASSPNNYPLFATASAAAALVALAVAAADVASPFAHSPTPQSPSLYILAWLFMTSSFAALSFVAKEKVLLSPLLIAFGAVTMLVGTAAYVSLRNWDAAWLFGWAFTLIVAVWSQNHSLQRESTATTMLWQRKIIHSRISMALFTISSFFVVLVTCHGVSVKWLLAEFPPDGAFYTTNYTSGIHMHCMGSGSPTVVFETGLASTRHDSFQKLFDRIIQTTRACWYDRPGYLYSAPFVGDNQVQSIQLLSANLHHLLQEAGESPPYLLVGHSIAGLYLRDFVLDHFEDVSGLMLLDTSHERQAESPNLHPPNAMMKALALNAITPLIPSLSALRLFASLFSGGAQDTVSSRDAYHYLNGLSCKSILSELMGSFGLDNSDTPALHALTAKLDRVRSETGTETVFAHLPLTLLTGGLSADAYCGMAGLVNCTRVADLPALGGRESARGSVIFEGPGAVPPPGDMRGWLAFQRDQAAGSADAVWELFADASHFVHLDRFEGTVERLEELKERAVRYWRSKLPNSPQNKV
ncbi:hypothetical protein BC830DRAFT_1080114 [Chytriomyces sp. MP71]|nr:hypothetical protein BC830DRAFT_1080114 [Chytriomyces sp. MP71]